MAFGYWVETTKREEVLRQVANLPINIQASFKVALQWAQAASRIDTFGGGPETEVSTVFRIELDEEGAWPINPTPLRYSEGVRVAPINSGAEVQAVGAYTNGMFS